MLTRRLSLWTPYSDLRREIDRLFDTFTGGDGGLGRVRAFPAVNVWEEGDNLFLEAELPGVARDDLEISAVGNELTLRGRRNPRQGENLVYHRQERGFGEFTRVLTLPVEVDTDKIEATLRDGVLTLTLPKAEAAKARKIEVKAAE
jgi:HSP20 family protein